MNLASTLLYASGALVLLLLLLYQFSMRTARRIERALPPAGLFVEAGGVRLHVRDEGEGPALLLIHGLNGQMAHFNYGPVRELSRRYRVVTIDRPGSGYSARPDGVPADLSTQARAIAALIDRLNLGQPTVVGHSLGGAAALTLALDHPGKVGALALIAPLTHTDGTVPPAFRALAIESAWLRCANIIPKQKKKTGNSKLPGSGYRLLKKARTVVAYWSLVPKWLQLQMVRWQPCWVPRRVPPQPYLLCWN